MKWPVLLVAGQGRLPSKGLKDHLCYPANAVQAELNTALASRGN